MSVKHSEYWRKVSERLSKLHFPSPEESFVVFLKRFTILFITLGLYPRKGIQLFAENVRPPCQAGVLAVQVNILRKNNKIVEKILNIPDSF